MTSRTKYLQQMFAELGAGRMPSQLLQKRAAVELWDLVEVAELDRRILESRDRAQAIRQAVKAAGRIDTPALTARFNCSRWTVRRAVATLRTNAVLDLSPVTTQEDA